MLNHKRVESTRGRNNVPQIQCLMAYGSQSESRITRDISGRVGGECPSHIDQLREPQEPLQKALEIGRTQARNGIPPRCGRETIGAAPWVATDGDVVVNTRKEMRI